MAQVADPRAAGREAAERRRWQEAYDLLSGLDGLGGPELAALADAAYWTGRYDEALELRERAYAAHDREGNRPEAAAAALRLAFEASDRGAIALFNGWVARGERQLEGEPEGPVHGVLAMAHSVGAELHGDLVQALAHAEELYELGRRYGDRDLEALGLVGRGRILLRQGALDEAFALLDEGATAVSGDIDPFCSCVVYCATISSAQHVGDFERARQWTEAANRWYESQEGRGYPGVCRVHRSEILGLGGEWEAAELEAASACSELGSYDLATAAAGFYQIGEIRRRRGDFAAAEEAYRKAHDLGAVPQPGLALLRLAEGQLAEAQAGLSHALDDATPFSRARRLPAQVEIALAAGDLEAARAALKELEELTDRLRVGGRRSTLLAGALELARGQIALAEGDLEGAEASLRRAVTTWTGIGAPYEAATARMLLGLVYERRGDAEGARLEHEAAKATFEKLGAILDAQRAMERLGEAQTRRTFVFTDIVDSTRLLDTLGDEKWQKLLDRHDAILRKAIEGAGGEVIKHTGDGFFAAFETPRAAVEAAVETQRRLDDEVISVRIGLHSGEALDRGDDYAGRGVNVAARIGALASGGEILASRETLDGVPLSYRVSGPKHTQLKGFAESVELVSLAWR